MFCVVYFLYDVDLINLSASLMYFQSYIKKEYLKNDEINVSFIYPYYYYYYYLILNKLKIHSFKNNLLAFLTPGNIAITCNFQPT